MASEIAGPNGRKSRPPAAPERARLFLQRLGPVFVKFGQYLALCPDLLPAEYCAEFMRLDERPEPFSFDEVKQAIAADLGASPEQLFTWINPRPLAAGLLSQAHAAHTLKQHEVVIKVQKPGIRDIVERDLRRENVFHRILEMVQADPSVRAQEVVEEFGRRIREELDLGAELRNLTAMADFSPDDARWRLPRPYPSLSGSGVLTYEFLSGVPLSEALAFGRSGSGPSLASLRIDPEKVAENLLYSMLSCALQRRLFQANLLPANVVVLSGNVIGYFNFFWADGLDPGLSQSITRCLSALSHEDIDRALDEFIELTVSSQESNLSQMRAEFYDESTITPPNVRWGKGGGSVTSHYVLAMLRAARRNGFRVPSSALSLFRTLVTAERLAHQLDASADVKTVGQPLFNRMQLLAILSAFLPNAVQPALLDGIGLMSDGPRNLRRLLADLVDGRMVIRVRTMESDEDRRQANVRARLVATATVSVGVAVLLGATHGALALGLFPLSWLLWALLFLVWGWIAIQWRDLE